MKQWKREYGTDEPMEIVRDIYKETPHVHRAYREILGQHAVFRMEGQIDDYMDMVKDKLASSAPDIKIGAKTQRIENEEKVTVDKYLYRTERQDFGPAFFISVSGCKQSPPLLC